MRCKNNCNVLALGGAGGHPGGRLSSVIESTSQPSGSGGILYVVYTCCKAGEILLDAAEVAGAVVDAVVAEDVVEVDSADDVDEAAAGSVFCADCLDGEVAGVLDGDVAA